MRYWQLISAKRSRLQHDISLRLDPNLLFYQRALRCRLSNRPEDAHGGEEEDINKTQIGDFLMCLAHFCDFLLIPQTARSSTIGEQKTSLRCGVGRGGEGREGDPIQ